MEPSMAFLAIGSLMAILGLLGILLWVVERCTPPPDDHDDIDPYDHDWF
jgi:flagellar biogenesis protein FliO